MCKMLHIKPIAVSLTTPDNELKRLSLVVLSTTSSSSKSPNSQADSTHKPTAAHQSDYGGNSEDCLLVARHILKLDTI